jgi:hypothetical protein
MPDALHKQGQALENQFFSQVDQKLLEQLRQRLAKAPERDLLAQISGIQNPAVLDKLLALGIDAATFASLTFVPLAAVAWADGTLDAGERKAILQAAEQHQLKPDGPGYKILSHWLDKPVSAELVATWKAYVAELHKALDAAAFANLRGEILGLAEKIADASGGILGLGERISPAEKRKLEELRTAFDVG